MRLKLWSEALGQYSRSEHTENVSHLLLALFTYSTTLYHIKYFKYYGIIPVMSEFMACCIRRHPIHDRHLRLNVHLCPMAQEQTFQVAVVVKKLPAIAGDARDLDLIPG